MEQSTSNISNIPKISLIVFAVIGIIVLIIMGVFAFIMPLAIPVLISNVCNFICCLIILVLLYKFAKKAAKYILPTVAALFILCSLSLLSSLSAGAMTGIKATDQLIALIKK